MLRAIRQWAREQGLQVSDRGRIPAEIVARYDAAH
jgi:nucleoid-associated protein Lsr2